MEVSGHLDLPTVYAPPPREKKRKADGFELADRGETLKYA